MMACGSIIIPTDTKKTAPNKSFTGLVRCSTFSAEVVSARILPIINAPSSAEKPACTASTTIPKQSPMESINKFSSSNHFFAFFSNVGIKKIPMINHSERKNKSLRTIKTISPPSICFVTAMVESNTISKITTMSSTINTPKTTRANCLVFTPSSSNALMMIVVDELANIPPRNKLSITDHCNHLPNRKPAIVIKAISTNAVMDAEPPTLINFLKLNSRPNPNSKNITPSSATTSILSISITVGKSLK